MVSRSLGLLLVLAAAGLAGCQDLMSRMQTDPKEAALKKGSENATAALMGKDGHSKLIGDYIKVSGYNWVVLEGVALVVNLDGTGEDPPPSPLRAMLLDDMRRRQVEDPQTLLRSKDTAMVVVRAYLPPLIKKGETFDVEVVLPDGSKTTSLANGYMLPCDLKEHAYVQGGGTREGKLMAKAMGSILLATGEGDQRYEAANMRRGTIPGGATYVMQGTRKLTAIVRNDYRSAKLTHRIAQRIGERFHDYDDHGLHKPLAEAQTDLKIELTVPEKYRDNYPRFQQIIRNIALKETNVDRHMRVKALRDSLLIPEECEQAALELEAIGPEAAPILKEGLKASNLECRFRAAEALAYLNDAAGVEALQEAADKEPAFRVFSLVALASMNDGTAFQALYKLMNHESLETRYGAFRALSEANPNDPNIQGEKMPGGFSLHVLQSTGKPMIHVTQRRKAEITIFGANQEFTMPMVARAGGKIMVLGEAGASKVRVIRIAANEARQEREVSTRVADVIKACAELQAGYPDIVQLLVQAEHNANLPGNVGIDEMPRAGRVYVRNLPENKGSSETTVGSENQMPNLFDTDLKPSGALPPEESVPETLSEKDDSAKSKAPVEADLDAKTTSPKNPKSR
ncbi:MAG TPA: flagellar basal body P-ring protein FlgI [Caulifigura sp.]|nr:flagellar basal body P-ring protein FlgI [Caulifigura sp.]